MKHDLLPQSQATNLWDLCLEVIQILHDVEARFNWNSWISTDPSAIACVLQGTNLRPPACGTQACLGGWMWVLLTGDPNSFDLSDLEKHFPNEVRQEDGTRLRQDLQCICYGTDLVTRQSMSLNRRDGESQHEYVERAVCQMRLFMTRWEHELKAAPV